MASLASQRAGKPYHIFAGQSHELFEADPNSRGDILAIVNMDKATGPGTHWTAFVIPENRNAVYYYDSLGKAPPRALARKLRAFSPNILYHDTQVQPDKSNKCGFYALDFIERFLKNKQLYGGKISQRNHAKSMAQIDARLLAK